MTENNLLKSDHFAPLAVQSSTADRRSVESETFSGVVACGTIAISTIVAFMIAFGIGKPHVGALREGSPVVWTTSDVGERWRVRADFALGMDS